MNPSITNRKGAKVRFFAIYSLSVVLIFFLVTSFLMPQQNEKQAPANSAAYRAAFIEQLHAGMAPLRESSIRFIEQRGSSEAKATVEAQAAAYRAMMDSLRRETETIDDVNEKKALESLLQQFSRSAEKEQALVQAYPSQSANNAATSEVAAKNEELEELKAILVKKDETIASLQQQKQTAPGSAGNPGNSEWKEKYDKLKMTAEKSSSQLEAMRASYKEVVEDNRRLIAQLQAARAGKN